MKECPVADLSCPYYNRRTGNCKLENPYVECDDYYACVGDEEEDDEFI